MKIREMPNGRISTDIGAKRVFVLLANGFLRIRLNEIEVNCRKSKSNEQI